jgi:AraC-like DNA-binding protein
LKPPICHTGERHVDFFRMVTALRPGRYILYAVAFTGVLLLASCARGPVATVHNWSVCYNPNISLDAPSPGEQWLPLPVPSAIKPLRAGHGIIQHVWLRGTINITGDPSEYYGISLGRTFHTDEVYINRRFINSQGPGEFANIHFPSNYVIAPGILVKGDNTIHVRLGIYGKEWGGLLDEVTVLPKNDFLREKLFYDTWFDKVPFGIVLCLTAFMVIVFIFYLWNRKNTIFLYGNLMILAMIMYIIAMFSPHTLLLIPFEWIFIIHWILYPVMAFLVIIFIQSLYRVYFTVQNIVAFMVLFMLAAAMAVSRFADCQFYLRPFLAAATEVLYVGYIVFIMKRAPRQRQDRFKRNGIIILIAASQIAAAWDIFAYLTGSTSALVIPGFGSLAVVMINMVLGGRDVYTRLRASEHLYDSLKERAGKKPQPITNESEENLRWVMEFIKENYRSDLSREGLAEAVGMNPDYMSKLFKTFAGMKINEYVAKLRIEEAAGCLRAGNLKIIDIAFAVGFENIVSFNRTFKAVMGLTPSEYRVQNRPES